LARRRPDAQALLRPTAQGSSARADELAAGIPARHDIETLVGLDEFYAIEEETVDDKKSGNR